MTTETGPEVGLNAAMAATLNGERVASGMTFDQLADVTGIPKRTLLRKMSTIERHLNVEDVRRIAAAFDLSVIDVTLRAEERLARRAAAPVVSLEKRKPAPEPMSDPADELPAVAASGDLEESGDNTI